MRRGGPANLISRPSMSTTVSARAGSAARTSATASNTAPAALPRIGTRRDECPRHLGVRREMQVHVAQQGAMDQITFRAIASEAVLESVHARDALGHGVEGR